MGFGDSGRRHLGLRVFGSVCGSVGLKIPEEFLSQVPNQGLDAQGLGFMGLFWNLGKEGASLWKRTLKKACIDISDETTLSPKP